MDIVGVLCFDHMSVDQQVYVHDFPTWLYWAGDDILMRCCVLAASLEWTVRGNVVMVILA